MNLHTFCALDEERFYSDKAERNILPHLSNLLLFTENISSHWSSSSFCNSLSYHGLFSNVLLAEHIRFIKFNLEIEWLAIPFCILKVLGLNSLSGGQISQLRSLIVSVRTSNEMLAWYVELTMTTTFQFLPNLFSYIPILRSIILQLRRYRYVTRKHRVGWFC
jgi:hypothetical protein